MMEVSKFTEKLNKLDGVIYPLEEEISITNGVYVGMLAHDNVNKDTLNVYTGSRLTGEKITNYFLSTPSETPWKNSIKIFASVGKVYISYETTGDTVEAEDINNLQSETVRTQEALNSEVIRATSAENVITNIINTNKPNWDNKYTKIETDNKLSALVTSLDWKEAVATFQDIATTYPTPDDGWTVNTKDDDITYRYNGSSWIPISANAIPLATPSIDGKMSKSDKSKLDGVQSNANNYVHPSTHSASIIVQDSTHRLVSDTQIANWNDAAQSLPYVIATGSANAYAVTLSPAPTVYTDGMALCVKINIANTGASTLNVNGLGVKQILDSLGNAITAGGLKAGLPYTIRYNGTNFIVQGKGGGGNLVASDLLAGKTATGDNGAVVGTMINRVTQVSDPNHAGLGDDQVTVGRFEATKLWLGTHSLFYNVPPGYYDSSVWLYKSDIGFVSDNIKAGSSIFGVVGRSSVVDTADGTGVVGDILLSKTAYVNGNKVTGTMPNIGKLLVTLPINGTYSIAKGYHDGTGSITQSITTKGAATITPGVTTQTVAAGQYLSGIQTIAGDVDLISANIVSGKNIFGVVGSLSVPNFKSGTVTSSTTQTSFSGQSHAYVDISGFNFVPKFALLINPNNTQEKLSTVLQQDHFIIFPGNVSGILVYIAGSAIVANGRLLMPANGLNTVYNYYIIG